MTKFFQKFVYEVGPGEIGFSRLDILDPPNISFHPIGIIFMVQKFLFNSLCSRLCVLCLGAMAAARPSVIACCCCCHGRPASPSDATVVVGASVLLVIG